MWVVCKMIHRTVIPILRCHSSSWLKKGVFEVEEGNRLQVAVKW